MTSALILSGAEYYFDSLRYFVFYFAAKERVFELMHFILGLSDMEYYYFIYDYI